MYMDAWNKDLCLTFIAQYYSNYKTLNESEFTILYL